MEQSLHQMMKLFHLSIFWTRCNTMVISWILNSVSKDIASSVIYANTTQEMWEDLKERFAQGNGPQVFEIQKAISSLTQD